MLRKLLQIVILLSSLGGLAFGSGIRYDNIALTTKTTAFGTAMVPVSGASIAVCSQPAVIATTPCSPRINLYADQPLTQPISNPTSADSKGNYHFYYDSSIGSITIQIYASTVQTFNMPDQNGVFSLLQSFTWGGTQVFDTINVTTANITSANITNLTVGGQSITFPLSIGLGGTGATSFAAAFLPVFSGTPVAGNCVSWLSSTVIHDNGAPCGGGAGGGTVTSVGMTGDGVVYKSAVGGSPITGAGTLVPALADTPSGYVLAGPIGSVGSNVGIRQFVHCTFHTAVNADVAKNFACPAFGSPIIAGDALLVISPQLNPKTGSSTFTDTLGNTISNASVTRVGSSSTEVAYGTITVGGSDTVSGANIAWWDNGGSWSQYDFWVLELTGSSGINVAASTTGTGTAPYNITISTTPGASTDSIIRLAMLGSNTILSPDTGDTTFSPGGSNITTFVPADINMGFGASDIFAPGSTTTVSNIAEFNRTGGTSTSTALFFVVDLTQSPSAGSAPWIARRLTPGDLPLSSVNVVNAVTTFNLASNTNIPTNTDVTVLSGAITMPAGGCPCRVLFQGSMLWTATVGSTAWGWWASDGTNTFGWATNVPTDSTTVPVQISEISPVSYANNQSVTFSFHFRGSYSGGTITAVTNITPPLPSSARTHMTLTIIQSRN